VWLNPPFGDWKPWVRKVKKEWESGRIKQMCVFVAARTITAKSFAPVRKTASAVCMIHGRRPCGGIGTKNPDDGHVVFYLGKDKDSFVKHFSVIGTVFVAPQ
jgi:hypothetical protein